MTPLTTDQKASLDRGREKEYYEDFLKDEKEIIISDKDNS